MELKCGAECFWPMVHSACLTAIVALLLAGCGTHGVSSALPGSASLNQPNAGVRQREANSENDLLYVTDDQDSNHPKVLIYSYPHGKLEKEIRGYYGENFNGECADGRGNVYVIRASYVTSGNTFIDKYAHGGTTPIRRLFDHLNFDRTCAVDPTSGDLAVTGSDGVKVWYPHAHHGKHRRGLPLYFSNYACSYDDRGNLFVNGSKAGKPQLFRLVELPKGSRTFVNITLPRMQTTKLGPGGIRWDGQYLAFSNRANEIYRLTVSGTKARLAGTVDLKQASQVSSIWIHGKTIVGGGYIWDYPAGGTPIGTIAAGDSAGVAVSVPPR
jgi:hypothetical protein